MVVLTLHYHWHARNMPLFLGNISLTLWRGRAEELRRRMRAAGVEGGIPALELLSGLLFGSRGCGHFKPLPQTLKACQ
jgi:hypothetical protein